MLLFERVMAPFFMLPFQKFNQAMAPLTLLFQKFDAVVNVKHQCGAALSPCLRYFNSLKFTIYFNLYFTRRVASLSIIRSVGQILYCCARLQRCLFSSVILFCRARLQRASSTHPSHRFSFLRCENKLLSNCSCFLVASKWVIGRAINLFRLFNLWPSFGAQ